MCFGHYEKSPQIVRGDFFLRNKLENNHWFAV